MRGVAATGLALLAAAGFAVPAAARTLDMDYRATGEIRAAWTAAGGERGSVAKTVADESNLSLRLTGDSGRSDTSSQTQGFAGAGVVRVHRKVAGKPPGICVDPLATGAPGVAIERTSRRSARVHLAMPQTSLGLGLSSGRCPGPLEQDLETYAPAGRLDLRRVQRRPVTVSLRRRRAFTAGAVRGKLESTVVVRFERARVRRSRARATARQTARFAPYSVAAVEGSLTTEFRGGDGPACVLLDACELAGTSTIRFTEVSGEVDLGTGGGSGFLSAQVAAIEGRAARPGGPTCADRAEVSVGPDLVARRRADGSVRLELRPDDPAGGGDLLRTRCAGPSQADAKGALAVGEIPAGAVGASKLEVVLRGSAPLRPGRFAGRHSGELVLTLAEERPL